MTAFQFQDFVDASPRVNTAVGSWQNTEVFPATERPIARLKPLDPFVALLIAQLNLDPSGHPKTEVLKFTEQERPLWAQHTNNVSNFAGRNSLVDVLRFLDKPQAFALTRKVRELSAHRLASDPGVQACFYNARNDAARFAAMLPEGIDQPRISISDDGEIVFDWRWGTKQAIVDFDGDGSFGYALLQNGRFEPGAETGDLSKGAVPLDFRNYFKDV